MNSIIKKIIDSYEIDHKSTTVFLDIFLDELIDSYKYIEAGYIGIISHDMWLVHSHNNIDFSEFLKVTESISPLGVPIFTDRSALDSLPNNYYKTANIADFYSSLPQEIILNLKTLHNRWSKFLIVPLTTKKQLQGHIILCIGQDTSDSDLDKLIEPLDLIARLIASCYSNVSLKTYNDALSSIIKTSNSVASTHRFTGYIHKTFLSTLLKLAINLIPEADYGASIIIDNGLWIFDDAIGHDIESLRSIPITKDLFEINMLLSSKSNQVEHNVYIIDNILMNDPSNNEPLNTIHKTIKEKSLPIKSSLQVHIMNRGTLKGLISLDISPNNPLQFSNQAIQILKQIGLIGSMFFSYNTLYGYTESFNRLTKLISDSSGYGNTTDTQFKNHFLELMIQGIPEANYASIYIRRNGKIHYIDALGHDINILKNLDIDETCFEEVTAISSDPENITPFSIYRNIQDLSLRRMVKDTRKQFLNAVRPVKESMMCHFLLDENSILDIAIDISKESLLSFTNESIIMFKSYANIGFAFMAQQFFSEQINHLTESIEEHEVYEANLVNQNQDLTHMIRLDGLTNLYNHTYIVSLLKQEIENSKENGTPLTIVLFDIDFFKKINDLHGHVTGDHVLISISTIIKIGHSHQYAGRYGGEEFLTILPNTNLDDALDYASHIRKQIESTVFDNDLTLTISGGIAQWEGESTTDLIRKADQLLYSAKEKGRNRIEIKL